MTERSTKDIIKDMREIVKPFISDCLKHVNYEGKGDIDKAEFETEFEKVLTLAEKAETLKGDLISRQAVLYELKKWDWQDLYLPIHFKQILDDVPSADVRPNIHGHWKNPTYIGNHETVTMNVCSECGKEFGWDIETGISIGDNNFCPNCGAVMREPKGEKGTE